jgi:hypothetical protein
MTDDQEAPNRESSQALDAEPVGAIHGLVIADSQDEGGQLPFLELTDQGIKTRTLFHEQHLERMRAEHDLEQQAQDNAGRRRREDITYAVIIGAVVAGLIFSAVLSIWTTDDETRRWAQSFVTFIFGGILGGLAGYFTGKRDQIPPRGPHLGTSWRTVQSCRDELVPPLAVLFRPFADPELDSSSTAQFAAGRAPGRLG